MTKHKRRYRHLSHISNRRWYQVDSFAGHLSRFACWRVWKAQELRMYLQLARVVFGARHYDELDFHPEVRRAIPVVLSATRDVSMALWQLRAAVRMIPRGVLFFLVLILLYVA